MATVDSLPTLDAAQVGELPATKFRTLGFAPCPFCQRVDFKHIKHRAAHIAKHEREGTDLPARFLEFVVVAPAPTAAIAEPAPVAPAPRVSMGPWLEELDVDWAAKARGAEITR